MLINSFVNLGLILIFLFVLIMPLVSTKVENNLEIFLLLNGLLAMTVASFAQIPGVITGWRWEIVLESLTSPIWIGDIFWNSHRNRSNSPYCRVGNVPWV